MEGTSSYNLSSAFVNDESNTASEADQIEARRTAFVARFIVLRESKRTKAHRVIEMMEWMGNQSKQSLPF